MNEFPSGELVRELIKNAGDGALQLSPIRVNEDYRKKWNINQCDFVCLTRNGELISNSLYRVGGIPGANDIKNDYFLLLKHVEAFYEDSITTDKNRKPHLESRWVILDKTGKERIEFPQFKSLYLTCNSILYSVDGEYYNIETGECYGSSYHSFGSDKFLFLDNKYHKDPAKRGVLKINKKDGSKELFT